MRLDSLVRLIEAADFMSFRELALECLKHKGYRELSLTDGWKDGGTDLRLFELPPNTTPIGFQITVEKEWKGKLKSDAKKCRERLGLRFMTLVCSRRIPEHEFEEQREQIWQAVEVQVNRIDSQSIASTFFSAGATGRVLEILGIETNSTGPKAPPADPRAEAALAFSFFGQDAQSFRELAVESTVVSVLSGYDSLSRDGLVSQVVTVLNLHETQAQLVRSAIDRLLQRKELVGPADSLQLHERLAEAVRTLHELHAHEEAELKKEIRETLEAHARKVEEDNIEVIVRELGALMIESAKDSAIAASRNRGESVIHNTVRTRLRHVHSTLDAMGIAEGIGRDRLLEKIVATAVDSPIAKHLFSGELFLSMLSTSTPQLVRAFGARTGIQVLLDASVAIPMLCALLYGVVPNRFSIAAKHAYDQLTRHQQSFILPIDYLEEVATHLIRAHLDYLELVDIDEDLSSSENSFVSQYVSMRRNGEIIKYGEFLSSFGLDDHLQKAEFYVARDRLKLRLQKLFDRYGIEVSPLGNPSHDSFKRAEEGIAYAINSSGRHRPPILQKHDARTIAYLHDRDRSADEADVLCTWDNAHFWMNNREPVDWLVMNPAILGDIFAVARGADFEGNIRGPAILVRALTEEAASLGASVLDKIARLERGRLHDAQLLAEAKRFKDEFVKRAVVDRPGAKIEDEWTKWKTEHLS